MTYLKENGASRRWFFSFFLLEKIRIFQALKTSLNHLYVIIYAKIFSNHSSICLIVLVFTRVTISLGKFKNIEMYNPGIFRDWSERRFLLSRNIPGAAPQGLTLYLFEFKHSPI